MNLLILQIIKLKHRDAKHLSLRSLWILLSPSKFQKKKKKKGFAYAQVYYTTQAFLSNEVKSGIDAVI